MPFVPPPSLVSSRPQDAARILNKLVRVSVEQRRSGRVPALYASGVRYRREPRGVDQWLTAAETFRRGWGDCEDLAVWLAADHILAGDKAEVVIKKVRPGLSHALVLTNGKFVRDPSRKLGMNGAG